MEQPLATQSGCHVYKAGSRHSRQSLGTERHVKRHCVDNNQAVRMTQLCQRPRLSVQRYYAVRCNTLLEWAAYHNTQKMWRLVGTRALTITGLLCCLIATSILLSSSVREKRFPHNMKNGQSYAATNQLSPIEVTVEHSRICVAFADLEQLHTSQQRLDAYNYFVPFLYRGVFRAVTLRPGKPPQRCMNILNRLHLQAGL